MLQKLIGHMVVTKDYLQDTDNLKWPPLLLERDI